MELWLDYIFLIGIPKLWYLFLPNVSTDNMTENMAANGLTYKAAIDTGS